MIWLFFVFLVILESCADIYAKKYSSSPSSLYFISALILYLAGNASWLISMKLGMKLWRGVVIFASLRP